VDAPATKSVPARRPAPWWWRCLRLGLDTGLVLLLLGQGYLFVLVSTHQHLLLPGFLRDILEQRLQAEGLGVRFDELDVTLDGSLFVRRPRILLTGVTAPVAEADTLVLRPDWLSLIWEWKLELGRLRLANGRLYYPPEISTTGAREAYVSQFDLSLSNEGSGWWRLDYLRTDILNARVLAQGEFIQPALPAPAPAAPSPPAGQAPVESLAARYRDFAREVQQVQPQLARVTNPVVNLQLDAQGPGGTSLELFALADGAAPPVPAHSSLSVGRFWVRAEALFDGQNLRAAAPALVWVDTLDFEEMRANGQLRQAAAGGPAWVRVLFPPGPNGLLERPARIWSVIAPVSVYDFSFDSMATMLDLQAWPRVNFLYYTAYEKYWLRAQGQVDLEQRTLDLDYNAYVDPPVVLRAAELKIPPELASLRFDSPPRGSGHITLAAGFQPQSLDFRLETGGAHFAKINLSALSAAGHLTPTDLDLRQVSLWNQGWRVDGAYSQNFKTDDFRILAHGTVDPGVLDPYLGKWWPPLWKYIVPGANWPEADIDYTGAWSNSLHDTVIGSASLAGGRVKGVLMDNISLRLYIRPDVNAVYNLVADAHGGGRLRGALLWMSKPPSTKLYEQRYLFESTLPLRSEAIMSGPDVVELTAPLDCPTAPEVRIDQRTGGEGNPQPEVTVTKLAVKVPAPLHAYGVPLDWLAGSATFYDGFSDIPELDLGIANGHARARATVHRLGKDSELAFSILMQGGHHTGFLYAISQFNPNGGTTVAPAAAPAAAVVAANHAVGAAKTAASTKPSAASSSSASGGNISDLSRPGLMDLTMGGRVLLNNKDSFAAAGHARIYEANLGQLQLIGLLSRLLSGTIIPMGSFNLDSASTDVQIAHQYARFPNLVVTGSSARIIAAGLYNIPGESLNFDAVLFPLGQWTMPVISQVISIFSTLNNTITVTLTGSPTDPDWSISMNPLRVFNNSSVSCPPIPGYPANPDGSPVLPALPFPPPPMPTGPLPPPPPPAINPLDDPVPATASATRS
jgi:hypothetical protein